MAPHPPSKPSSAALTSPSPKPRSPFPRSCSVSSPPSAPPQSASNSNARIERTGMDETRASGSSYASKRERASAAVTGMARRLRFTVSASRGASSSRSRAVVSTRGRMRVDDDEDDEDEEEDYAEAAHARTRAARGKFGECHPSKLGIRAVELAQREWGPASEDPASEILVVEVGNGEDVRVALFEDYDAIASTASGDSAATLVAAGSGSVSRIQGLRSYQTQIRDGDVEARELHDELVDDERGRDDRFPHALSQSRDVSADTTSATRNSYSGAEDTGVEAESERKDSHHPRSAYTDSGKQGLADTTLITTRPHPGLPQRAEQTILEEAGLVAQAARQPPPSQSVDFCAPQSTAAVSNSYCQAEEEEEARSQAMRHQVHMQSRVEVPMECPISDEDVASASSIAFSESLNGEPQSAIFNASVCSSDNSTRSLNSHTEALDDILTAKERRILRNGVNYSGTPPWQRRTHESTPMQRPKTSYIDGHYINQMGSSRHVHERLRERLRMKIETGEIPKVQLTLVERGRLVGKQSARKVKRVCRSTRTAMLEAVKGMSGLSDAGWQYEQRREQRMKTGKAGLTAAVSEWATFDASLAFGVG